MRESPAGAATLRLTGELDLANAEQLRDDLAALSAPATGAPVGGVVVDLAEVTFLDACILGVFAGADARLRACGCGLRLTNAAASVARLLRLTGLDHLLQDPTAGDHRMRHLAAPPTCVQLRG